MALNLSTYVLSNRKDDETIGPLQYLRCPNVANQRYSDDLARFKPESKAAWLTQLVRDLVAVCDGKPERATLALLIHGFNNSSQDAVTGLMHYGNALYAQGMRRGLVVGISWPSLFSLPTYGRDNAEGSHALLKAALDCFAEVQTLLAKALPGAPRPQRVVVAHSMGNYLLSKGLTHQDLTHAAVGVDRVLMLAPDVDNALFTAGSSALPQGEAIYKAAGGKVRVYWTAGDIILANDEQLGWWKVLGYRGGREGDVRKLSTTTPNVQFVRYDAYAPEPIANRYVPADYYRTVNSGCPHSVTRFAPGLLLDQLDFLAEGQWTELPDGPPWSDQAGWSKERYYSTIQCADIDGDGQLELLGRSGDGMHVWRCDRATGAWHEVTVCPGPSDAAGWGQPACYSTLQCADIDGDGQAELLGRGAEGIQVWKYDRAGKQWSLLPGGPNFVDSTGWNQAQHYSTIQCADVDGDGQAEVLARSAAGMQLWKYDRAQRTWARLQDGHPALSDQKGWAQAQYYSTIQCGDVDGDGQAELVARGPQGVRVWHFDKRTKAWVEQPDDAGFSAGEWSLPECYSTIQCVDVDGDGQAELVGRGADGIVIRKRDPAAPGRWRTLPAGPPLSNTFGWNKVAYYSTIRWADVDGDGQLELVARGPSGLQVWKHDKHTEVWTRIADGGPSADESGWAHPQYYSTIQYADLAGDGRAVMLARGGDGIAVRKYNSDE